MSYNDGLMAMKLEMSERVPRTEYSFDMHWELMTKVTGIYADKDSSDEVKDRAKKAMYKAWNIDFNMATAGISRHFGKYRTFMGHASFMDGGVDFNDNRQCPFEEPEDVLAFDPMEVFGEKDENLLIKEFEDHYNKNVAFYSDCINSTGPYVTCVSGLIDMFGWDMLLMASGMDPDGFGHVTNRYGDWMMQCFEAMANSNVPYFMVHDDMVWTSGAVFHPDWYKKYVFPNYKRYFSPLLEAGKKIIYCCDGNFTEFIDDVAKTGVHGFMMEPTTDMKYIAERYGKTHLFFGNADTRILLYGTKEDIYYEVKRCMDIGKTCPGFVMAVGNHIPPNTPVDNALYYNEIYEKLSRR